MPSEDLTTRLEHITARQDALQTVVEQQAAILVAITAAEPPGLLPLMLTQLDTVNTHLSDALTAIATLSTNVASIANDTYSILGELTDVIAPDVHSAYQAILGVGYLIEATACLCSSSNPTLPPALGTGVSSADSEHCQRVQYLLDKLVDALTQVASALAAGAAMTSGLAAVMLLGGIVPGIDVASVPAAVIAGLVSLIGLAGAGRVEQLRNWYVDNHDALRDLLYSATSPSAASAAYDAYVDAHNPSTTDPTVALTLKLLPWSGVLNALYNPTDYIWDVSAYDGGVCTSVFLGFPDAFDLLWSGQNCSGSDYGIGPWPDRPYFTRATNYCATNDIANFAQSLHVHVEMFDSSGDALGHTFGVGIAYSFEHGVSDGHTFDVDIASGNGLGFVGGNGAINLHVLVTE